MNLHWNQWSCGVLALGAWFVAIACEPAEVDTPVIAPDAAAGGAVGCEGVALPEGETLDRWAGAAIDVSSGTRLLFSQGGDGGALCSAMRADLCADDDSLPDNLEIELPAATAPGTVMATDARWVEGDCDCCTSDFAADAASVELTAVTETCMAGRVELTGAEESAAGTTFVFAIPRC